MKRYILSAFAALCLAFTALAVPARPGAFIYRQPDGSIVRLELHGDEFFSWTTLAGTSQVVAKGNDGFYRPAVLDREVRERARARRREANRLRAGIVPRTHTDNPMTHGERRIPVILVEFKDVKFSLDQINDQFEAFLNQQGYSANGATGSVRDYFMDNSDGAFSPVFDVYGPVTLDRNIAYYGEAVKDEKGNITANDKQPELALYEACVKLNNQVDFSVYDYDGNGVVDMTLFYYAGYSQAEGASEDSIWPHQWSVQYSQNSQARSATFDGLRLGSYFCTAELRGNQGSNMCGIGVTAHEFGHSLGLPDFYDTNYDEDGRAGGLYDFSIMCSGSYLNESRTPPYYNSEERLLLGWLIPEDLPELPEGNVTFGSVKDGTAYRSYTDTDGEYFVYECRDGSGWDAFLPQGLVVYHVDKSANREVGGISPQDHWDKWGQYNAINAYGDHPCFYVVPAKNQNSLNYSGKLSDMVFPGGGNVTDYSPVDWEDYETGLTLSSISYAGGNVSLKASYTVSKTLKGTVISPGGKGLAGVHVVLQGQNPAQAPRLAPRMIDRRDASSNKYETVTDADGRFTLDLAGYEADNARISLNKDGFQPQTKDIALRKGVTTIKLTLYPDSFDNLIKYQYYNELAKGYMYGDGHSTSLMGAFRIPADELPEHGGYLNSVTFTPSFPAKYYIIVDSGSRRILTQELTGITAYGEPFTEDLFESQVEIPGGEDLYIGYALKDALCPDGYDGYLFYSFEGSGNIYLSELNLQQSKWSGPDTKYFLDLEAWATILPKTNDGGVETETFGQMDICAIADPEKGSYTAGYAFPLILDLPEDVTPSSVKWAHNGRDVSGAKSVTLTSGQNTVTAVLKLPDGSVETLTLQLNVQ